MALVLSSLHSPFPSGHSSPQYRGAHLELVPTRKSQERVSRKRHGAQVWDVDVHELESKFACERRASDVRDRRCQAVLKRTGVKSKESSSVSHKVTNQGQPGPSAPKELEGKGQVFVINRNGKINYYWDRPRRPHRLPPLCAFIDFSETVAQTPYTPLIKFGARVRQVAIRKEWMAKTSKKTKNERKSELVRKEDISRDKGSSGFDKDAAFEMTTLPVLLFPPHIPGVMARRAMLLTQLDRRRFDDYLGREATLPGPSPLRK